MVHSILRDGKVEESLFVLCDLLPNFPRFALANFLNLFRFQNSPVHSPHFGAFYCLRPVRTHFSVSALKAAALELGLFGLADLMHAPGV